MAEKSTGLADEARDENPFRPPLSLPELLEILGRYGAIERSRAAEVEAQTTTLRSQVLKNKVGSLRSQAASRYNVSPAEIVSAASLFDAREPRRAVNDTLSSALGPVSGA